MYCMGIDHHKQYSFITVLNEGGDIVKTGKVNNMSLDLEKFLVGMGEMRAVVEAGRLIQTVPGFGVFFSVLVAVEIADIGRFQDEGKLHCYAGVIPSTPIPHTKDNEEDNNRLPSRMLNGPLGSRSW